VIGYDSSTVKWWSGLGHHRLPSLSLPMPKALIVLKYYVILPSLAFFKKSFIYIIQSLFTTRAEDPRKSIISRVSIGHI
jgi:hypothetical protein